MVKNDKDLCVLLKPCKRPKYSICDKLYDQLFYSYSCVFSTIFVTEITFTYHSWITFISYISYFTILQFIYTFIYLNITSLEHSAGNNKTKVRKWIKYFLDIIHNIKLHIETSFYRLWGPNTLRPWPRKKRPIVRSSDIKIKVVTFSFVMRFNASKCLQK